MHGALWSKAFSEARPLLLALTALLFGFNWLFVWLTSLVELGALGMFLGALPGEFEALVGMPFSKVATPAGRIAVAYIDPVVIVAIVSWPIARGSDVVSGEIGRGTMELLLAQPVRRSELLFTQAAVTTLGAAILAAAAWLGTYAGLSTVALDSVVPAADFLPGAVNLFALAFFLAGTSTLMSSWDSYRWRTIGFMGAFYVLSLIVKIVARLAPGYEWLMYGSFLGAFEPQAMAVAPQQAWEMSLRYGATLAGLGLAAYTIAAVVFSRRDLPAPL